jgi:hypothetical protein
MSPRCSYFVAKWGIQLRRMLDNLTPGDVVTVTRIDRLALSTRDRLNTLAAITGKKAGDAWPDTTTPQGG